MYETHPPYFLRGDSSPDISFNSRSLEFDLPLFLIKGDS